VDIICAPFCGGQPKTGVELAPTHILSAGIEKQLQDLGWKTSIKHVPKCDLLSDEQDPPHKAKDNFVPLKHTRAVGRVCKEVKELVAESARNKRLPLTIGGDHSLGIGTLGGTVSAYGDIAVVWVDAHADINSPGTTESGNLHGMPVSFVLGLETCENIPGLEWTMAAHGFKNLKPSQLTYIGLRDVDKGEKQLLKRHGIKAFSMHDVDKWGINGVLERALAHVNPNRDKPIHLSFDVDGLDPSVAPATGTPVRGGLTFREGHFINEILWETGLVCAVDIMEVNPSLGNDQQLSQTVQIGCSLTRAALGETLL